MGLSVNKEAYWSTFVFLAVIYTYDINSICCNRFVLKTRIVKGGHAQVRLITSNFYHN